MKSMFLIIMFCEIMSMTFSIVDIDMLKVIEVEKMDVQNIEKTLWEHYKEKYQIKFTNVDEDAYRFKIYIENLEFIHMFNMQNRSFTLGENKFAHWTHEEYLVWLGNQKKDTEDRNDFVKVDHGDKIGNVSDRDWRQEGKVTPVKDQKECGSCYSFSTLGAIESHYLIYKNINYDLSEQDVVDCSSSYGNEGCDGGLLIGTYRYVKETGVSQESDYPYENKVNLCRKKRIPDDRLVFIDGFSSLQRRAETEMAQVVSNIGPVSVAIDASEPEFRFYKCGVYSSYTCKSTAVNHGVIVVGLGSNPDPHWIIKNSWGTDWGSEGYVLLARGTNMCGVAQDVKYPVLDQR